MTSFPLHSPWYYWYRGQRLVATLGLVLSALIMAGLALMTADLSLWAAAGSLLLNWAGFALLVFYVLLARSHLPDLAIGAMDSWLAIEILLPILLGFLITRCVTFCVARLLKGGAASKDQCAH